MQFQDRELPESDIERLFSCHGNDLASSHHSRQAKRDEAYHHLMKQLESLTDKIDQVLAHGDQYQETSIARHCFANNDAYSKSQAPLHEVKKNVDILKQLVDAMYWATTTVEPKSSRYHLFKGAMHYNHQAARNMLSTRPLASHVYFLVEAYEQLQGLQVQLALTERGHRLLTECTDILGNFKDHFMQSLFHTNDVKQVVQYDKDVADERFDLVTRHYRLI